MSTKKKIFLGLLGALVFLVGYLFYLLFIAPSTNLQSIYLIPKDAVFVVETQEPIATWEEIRESDVWQHLQKNDYFYEMTESIHKMDTVFYSKKKLFEFFGTRSLFFSVHMYKPKKYGLFYVIDLKRIAKLKLLNTYLNTLLNEDYTLSRRTYNDHEIIELYDKESRETLYLSFIKNQLIASYVHTLVEASIDEYSAPVIGRNLDFIEVKKSVGYTDMFRLYLQYNYLDQYVRYFTDTPKEWVGILKDHFLFSGFTFDLKSNNTILANGVTSMSPTTVGYLNALQKSGKAKRTIPKIAPKRTALYLSYGFESFNEFYKNFEQIQQEKPVEFERYTSSIEQIEKQLKINIKDNFVSWVGDEIALLQLQSSVTKGKNDVALVFKANEIEHAKTNLNFILKQIKKRTPIKFKQINYEGYAINFMSIKGFFKLLVGNLFNELDKPYFTIIDDYVVFSNKPNTLKSIISDFKENKTLDTSEDFQHFNRYFDQESSAFAYINTPVLYENMYAFVDNSTKEQIEDNKDFIICFPQIGFQLTPDASMFETKLVVDYQDAILVAAKDQFKENQLFGPSINTYKPPVKNILEVETIFNVKNIYPEDLNAKEYSTHYSTGELKVKVQLKDGLKHGRYFEYYSDGVIKIKGRFRKDNQVGVWRAYDKEGALIKRKRF